MYYNRNGYMYDLKTLNFYRWILTICKARAYYHLWIKSVHIFMMLIYSSFKYMFYKRSNDNSLLKYIYMSMWRVKGNTCNSSRENNIVYKCPWFINTAKRRRVYEQNCNSQSCHKKVQLFQTKMSVEGCGRCGKVFLILINILFFVSNNF